MQPLLPAHIDSLIEPKSARAPVSLLLMIFCTWVTVPKRGDGLLSMSGYSVTAESQIRKGPISAFSKMTCTVLAFVGNTAIA